MNDTAALASSPKVKQLASQGVPWASKLVSKGWSSLATNQKRLARSTLGISQGVTAVTPRRVRTQKGSGTREGPGQAGKTMSLNKEELITTVTGSTGETPVFSSWVINPSDVQSFPVGSVLAANYNRYKITSLQVRYSPTSSFETNGRVSIGFNKDSEAAVPATKTQFYELGKYCDTAAPTAVTLNIPGDNVVRFIREGPKDDPKLVDFGRIILTTYGFDGAKVAGEMFFRYTIVYSDPTFTSRLSQVDSLEEQLGPRYAKLTQSATETRLVFKSAGSWLATIVTETGTNNPTISGGTGQVYTSDGSLSVSLVVAQQAGAALVIATTTTPKVKKWTVSRV